MHLIFQIMEKEFVRITAYTYITPEKDRTGKYILDYGGENAVKSIWQMIKIKKGSRLNGTLFIVVNISNSTNQARN
jgi:hypothetical protein